jgi:hypothetical protein
MTIFASPESRETLHYAEVVKHEHGDSCLTRILVYLLSTIWIFNRVRQMLAPQQWQQSNKS